MAGCGQCRLRWEQHRGPQEDAELHQCVTPAGRMQEPRGPHCLCQRVPAEHCFNPHACVSGGSDPRAESWHPTLPPCEFEPRFPSAQLPRAPSILAVSWEHSHSFCLLRHQESPHSSPGTPRFSPGHQPSQGESQPRVFLPHQASHS